MATGKLTWGHPSFSFPPTDDENSPSLISLSFFSLLPKDLPPSSFYHLQERQTSTQLRVSWSWSTFFSLPSLSQPLPQSFLSPPPNLGAAMTWGEGGVQGGIALLLSLICSQRLSRTKENFADAPRRYPFLPQGQTLDTVYCVSSSC